MEDVKVRIAVMQSILVGGVSLGAKQIDEDVIFLNFRMILELIAFGSMVANKQKYTTAYSNFQQHWHAERVLRDLEKINPDFYPRPLAPPVIQPDGTKYLDVLSQGFLTKTEFVELYNYCGQALHAKNPYGSLAPGSLSNYTPAGWLSRIQELLSFHMARMVDADDGWLVVMHDLSDGRVHAMPFKPIQIHRISVSP